MDIRTLSLFVQATKAGSFAEAARQLDVDPSTVTRAVSRLEETLGCRLFRRTTRALTLTAAGERYLARAQPALSELEAAAADAADRASAPAGSVRVAASVAFGVQCVVPALPRLAEQHPAITVHLHLADHVIDMAREQVDLALRLSAEQPDEGISQRLWRARYRACASPAYRARHGLPGTPEKLAEHGVITFNFGAFRSAWAVDRQTVTLGPVQTITNALGLRAATLEGLGISLLAHWLVDDDIQSGRLIDCFPDRTVTPLGPAEPALWLVRPERRYTPRAVDAVRESLIELLRGPPASPSAAIPNAIVQ